MFTAAVLMTEASNPASSTAATSASAVHVRTVGSTVTAASCVASATLAAYASAPRQGKNEPQPALLQPVWARVHP